MVQNKDGTWNCIDYRYLNKIIAKNQYPIPWIDYLLDQLKWGRNFTKISLNSGYYKVPTKKSDVWNTAFKSMEGILSGWSCLLD